MKLSPSPWPTFNPFCRFQVGLIPPFVSTDKYRVAVSALKTLISEAPISDGTFLGLLGLDRGLLAALVSDDIVSNVQGKIEFQSHAARFFVAQLPSPPQPPPPRGWFGFGK